MSFERPAADPDADNKNFTILVLVVHGRATIIATDSVWCLLLFEQDPNETGHQSGPPGPPGKGTRIWRDFILLQLRVASGDIYSSSRFTRKTLIGRDRDIFRDVGIFHLSKDCLFSLRWWKSIILYRNLSRQPTRRISHIACQSLLIDRRETLFWIEFAGHFFPSSHGTVVCGCIAAGVAPLAGRWHHFLSHHCLIASVWS